MTPSEAIQLIKTQNEFWKIANFPEKYRYDTEISVLEQFVNIFTKTLQNHVNLDEIYRNDYQIYSIIHNNNPPLTEQEFNLLKSYFDAFL